MTGWLTFSTIDSLTAPFCLPTIAGASSVITLLMLIPHSSKCSINALVMSSPFVVSGSGFKQQSSSLIVELQLYLAMTAKHGMSFTFTLSSSIMLNTAASFNPAAC